MSVHPGLIRAERRVEATEQMEGTLERSVLERKEREELATIATALGMKPSGRSKKETLIDQILKTAGVLDAPSEKKPRRGPARKGDAAGTATDDAGSPAPAAPTPSVTRADRADGSLRGPKPAPVRSSSTLFDPFADAESASAGGSEDDEAA